MAGLFSSASSGSLATEAKVKLRLCFGGEFVQGPDGRWVYTGGSSYNESLPGALDYCQFMWKLSEKLNTAVSVKYQAPGEALDPDSLVSVGDDADVQELMEEYRNAQMRAGPGASSTLRIRVFAFPASEEELTAEEIEDGLIFMGEQSQYSRQTSRSGLERKSSLSSNSSCSHPSALPSSDTEFVLHNGLSAYTNTMHHMPSPLALDSSALAADRCHSWSEGTMQQFIARQLGRGLSKADAIMRQRNEQRSSSALAAAAAAAGRSSGPSGGGTIGGGGGSGGMMSGGEAGGRAALLAAAAVAVASPRRGSGARAVVDGGKRQAAVGGAEPMQMTFADGSCPPDVYVEPRDMDDDDLRYLFPSNLLSDNGGIGGDGDGVDAMAITPLHGGSRLVRLPSHISEFGDAPAQDDEAGQRGTWQEDGEGVNGVGGGGCGGGADDAGGRFKTQEIAMQDYEESLALLQPTHEFPLSPPRPPPPMLDLNGLGDPLTMSAGPVTDMIATPQLGAPAEGAGGGTAAPGGVLLARGVLPPPGLAGGAGTQLRTHSASSHDRQVLTDTLPPVHCVNKADVKVLGKIGEGAFGEVLRASVPIFGQVAIKWLKSERFTKHSESFWKEAEVLSTLNHPNVLRFFGVVYDASQRGASPTDFAIVGIITEYVRGGSLAQLLRPSQPLLSLKARCALALHAVNGMQYLHEMKIVHFDLKPDNLLVDAGGSSSLSAQEAEAGGLCLKVADFGLSKHKANRFVSDCRDLRGTLPYMAPELVADPERVSEKADVWSMGVVMWEMLTREVPYQELTPQQILMGLMCGNLQLQIPEWCEPEWRGLLEACCEPNPGNRPSFAELQRQLTAIYEQQP